MKNIFKFTPPNPTNSFRVKASKLQKEDLYDKFQSISSKIEENITKMQYFLSYPQSSDVKIRVFETKINNQNYKSALFFFDGLVDSEIIDNYILRQLMKNTENNTNGDLEFCIVNNILSQNQLELENTYDKIIDKVLIGNCILLVDSVDKAFICDTKKLPVRSINKSENEMSTRGPNEAFVESLRINTGLLRKYVKDEHLIFEDIPIGHNAQTICSITYISNVANDSIIDEVKRRVSSIDIDYLLDSGQLEQLIEDKTYMTSPLIISTERPDKVAMHLFEGRIAILVAGSPNALVVPAVLVDFMHTSEDDYMRFPFSILLRFFRFPAAIISTLLPGIYIAIVTFHQEMLPTDLLFSIAATREKVPFPLLIELLIMETAFEIIREASLRTPTPMGPTLGIVGTLILGQAIVSANVVSPILVIIVALTGISSFAVANFSLNFTFRILRFVYIFLGAIAGFFGISIGLLVHACILSTATSFGVPYLSPYMPLCSSYYSTSISNVPLWKQENRPTFLKPKKSRKQPKITRKWVINHKK